ncbi:MAG TPA: hypothetical protein VGJ15_09835 [Pirellulales bacterium]|jgi:hypothetical protein
MSPLSKPSTIDIDFLPASFREAGIQRKNITWRLVVVVMVVGSIAAAAIYQQHLRRQAERELAAILPQYEQAKLQRKHLAETQQLLQLAEKRAELCTYLRHPWPRSQILAAVAEPLPEEIELTELDLNRETPAGQAGALRPAESSRDAEKKKIDPAQHDLAALREKFDHTNMVVKLTGVADGGLAVQRYLDELSRCRLFAKVEVVTIEQPTGDAAGRIHFTMSATVNPGYGQPGSSERLAVSNEK